jgi:MYXO-CTERM domain-containing protein
MRSKRALTVAVFTLLVSGCSENGAPGPREELHTSSFRLVGSTASVLREAVRTRMGTGSQFAFSTDTDEQIAVVADDFYFSGEYISAAGTALESGRSSFILKGDGADIYGWLVLHDRNVAYEYTTSAGGRVLVEKVPVSKIFPVCESEAETFDDEEAETAGPSPLPLVEGPPHIGEYDGQADTNKLQSRPGAAKVLFVDVAPLPLAKAQLWRAWQIVAASFSAFEVNVTTDAAVYEATPMRDRGKACSRPQTGRSSCGLNAFGTTRCCNIFNKGNGYHQGATFTHELGHLMGLRHDGATGGVEYFRGLNNFRWCPIMGASTPKTAWAGQALFQWSKGEYANANNKQDDLMIISRNLPFRTDDIPTSRALIIDDGSRISASENFGQIASNTDSDRFTFAVGEGGGRAVLTIDRTEYVAGGYLDVEAQIQDASGMVLAQGNDMAARTAKLDIMLPAGEYELIVKGGGEGTPQAGFSNYSSLGYYGISGEITSTGGGTDGGVDMGATGGAVDASATDAGDPGPATPGAGSTADSGAPGTDTGGGGGSGASGEGPGAGGGAVGEPAVTPEPLVDAGCSVATPSAGPPGPAAGLLLMLAIALIGRRRPRRR